MHDESLYAERAIRAGALGYITKQEATRNILVAIRRVLTGAIYLNEKIACRIISRLTSQTGAAGAAPTDLLSDRELKVFDLTGSGVSIREIANQMHIAVKTVETYRCRIKEKLKLHDSSELLQVAISWNQHR
jgi:DNA-binding NarL/FixJ family response regulator